MDKKEANLSLLVTKIRYAVELIFGAVKNRFKVFTNVWITKEAEHISDFDIACAIHNLDTQRFDSDKVNAEEIIRQIKRNIDKPNRLEHFQYHYE